MDAFAPVEAWNNAQLADQQIKMNGLMMNEKSVQIDVAKLALKNEQMKMAKMAELTGANEPMNVADQTDAMASISAATGNYKEAGTLHAQAATIRHNNQLTQRAAQEQTHKDLVAAIGILGSVEDSAQGWEQAKLQAHAEGLDKDPEIAELLKQPYTPAQGNSPSLIKALKDSIQTEKDKSTVKLNKLRGDRIIEENRTEQYRRESLKAHSEEARQRTDHLKKLGVDGAPKPQMVRLAKAQLGAAYSNMSTEDNETMNLYAEDIAQRATEIQSKTNLTRAQAVAKAYQEVRPMIHGLKPASSDLLPGQSKDKPASFPEKVVDEASAKKYLSKGTYYQTKKGVMVWDGSNFQYPKHYKKFGQDSANEDDDYNEDGESNEDADSETGDDDEEGDD